MNKGRRGKYADFMRNEICEFKQKFAAVNQDKFYMIYFLDGQNNRLPRWIGETLHDLGYDKKTIAKIYHSLRLELIQINGHPETFLPYSIILNTILEETRKMPPVEFDLECLRRCFLVLEELMVGICFI